MEQAESPQDNEKRSVKKEERQLTGRKVDVSDLTKEKQKRILQKMEDLIKKNDDTFFNRTMDAIGEAETMTRKTKADDNVKKSPNTVHLPAELWDKVRHKAVDEKTTISGIIEKALLAYLSE